MTGDVRIEPAVSLQGEVVLPGDDDLGSAALVVAAASNGAVRVRGIGAGRRTTAARAALGALGVQVDEDGSDVVVHGVGSGTIDGGVRVECGADVDLAQLVVALVAGRTRGDVVVDSAGDAPVAQLAAILTAMGARTSGAAFPLTVVGSDAGTELRAPQRAIGLGSAPDGLVAAAMLAAARASGTTTLDGVTGRGGHVAELLARAGADVRTVGEALAVSTPSQIQLPDTTIPADASLATTLAIGATVLHGSLVRLPGVLDSPHRRGALDILERMGARVAVHERRTVPGGAHAYDLEVTHAVLGRAFTETDDVGRIGRELPMLAPVGQFCRGTSVIRGHRAWAAAGQTHRDAVALQMRHVGISLKPLKDGYLVNGSAVRPRGGSFDAGDDPWLALTATMIGLASRDGVLLTAGAEAIDAVLPGALGLLDQLAVRSDVGGRRR